MTTAILDIKWYAQRQEETTPKVVAAADFNIKEWPVLASTAKTALAEIVDSHYILTPPIYDLPGQLVEPGDYFRRFRGAVAIVSFGITCYRWGTKNTICADLAHLRVLVTPSPGTPVTPRRKRPLDRDTKFSIMEPEFKKAKLEMEFKKIKLENIKKAKEDIEKGKLETTLEGTYSCPCCA